MGLHDPRRWRRGRLALCLLPLALVAGDPYRPAPKFAGKTIPDPPRQKEPWTPPPTKLPRFLARAAGALFDAGMADPRGCEYREVEVGDGLVAKARGFVLPERAGEAGRLVVGWDGIIRPAVTVGAPADLEADARAMVEALRNGRDEAARSPAYGAAGGFVQWHRFGMWVPQGVEPPPSRSPLTLAILLRLGRADLAESLFAAGTTWTPETPANDLTDYHITFLTMAREWGDVMYARLFAAHARGDDAVALDAARRLTEFSKAVETKAQAMGFPRPAPQPGGPDPVPYLGPFNQLAELLADQTRRAQEPPRPPIPPRGGDPKARIAALIRAFDQIHVVQFSSPGSANPGSSREVGEVIAEGEPAVDPLLAALENDTRLTRSITDGRGGGPGYVHPVTDAAYAALCGILQKRNFLGNGADYSDQRTPEGRRRLASAIRAYWEANRRIPLVDRWYRTLQDDAAGMDRWLEAAGRITEAAGGPRASHPGFVLSPPADASGGLKGDPLRPRRDPSVSELMARRVRDIERTGNPNSIPDIGLIRACELAELFARWDLAASLPSLKALVATCAERTRPAREEYAGDRGYARHLAQMTKLRRQGGDASALDDYAEWVKTVPPSSIADSLLVALEPIWIEPDRPSIAEAARSMFLDPKSPWLPLVPRERVQGRPRPQLPLSSPLLCLDAFRQAVLKDLEDRTPAGTAHLAKGGNVEYRLNTGTTGGYGSMRTPSPEDRVGEDVTFRVCDLVAWPLSSLEGAPECELYWDDARRDRAVSSCAEFLRRYGPRLSAEPLPEEHDFPNARAHLRFPTLARPASAEDGREARAIFSLEGQGEARVVRLPTPFPIRARWTTLKSFPIDQRMGDGSTRREYLQDGWVWQAEEAVGGEHAGRYYGFVGHATIARVPASEIVFPPGPYRSAALPDALDAQIRLAESPAIGFKPGEPIVVTLRLRNGLGVDRKVPTEFVRAAEDGRPALRRGVDLALFEVPASEDLQTLREPAPPTPREPTRNARFNPTGAARDLAPTESFEVLRLDLRDRFGDLPPGRYRARITFTRDSGIGEGTAGDVGFAIAPRGDAPR